MAKKVMTPVKAPYNAGTVVDVEEATSATDGFEVKLPGADESVFILATNTGESSGTITVKAPTNGSYAATDTDLTVTLAAGKTAVIRVESARFANNDGTIKLIPSATTVKAVAVY